MAKISFAERILLSSTFIKYLYTLEAKKRAEILRGLMYVNTCSVQHKKCHNVILASEHGRLEVISPSARDYWKSGMRTCEDPEFIQNAENSEVTRNIKYAVYLSDEKPYRCAILIGPGEKNKYLENSHYKYGEGRELKSIRVIEGEDASQLIISYTKQVWDSR
ncbi:hypothetical protein COU37_04885 [Candidatus Micrarchaeota archaeon CG10_big_fil_rev_8_21_14_0_10_45_29]|nr:MAG: hypothetical protein COU37_04885 [Candidatus Micrarchaeota archaeon CG10_big_fil_rev_8_21_14_0_10_45_29]